MFTIVDGKGFQIKFKNGWTVSVQWGPGNYCEKQDYGNHNAHKGAPFWASETAEVAVFKPDGEWVRFGNDTVKGWQTANEVAALIQEVWPRIR